VNPTGALDRPRLAAAATVAALVAVLAAASPARAASAWLADPARSRLAFVATQAGGEFGGQFKHFTTDITFDPGDLPGSRFHVVVDTGSADTQDETRDRALVGEDFFASGRWPTATFDATRFTPLPDGHYDARGRLTIRGVGRDVNVKFTFKPDADGRRAVLSGGTTIRRLDFGVGQGEWQDTKWVGNDVRIEFELVLAPGPARSNHNGT